MEAKTFISILKKPELLTDVSMANLESLSEQYPFSAILHTLLAKKVYQHTPSGADAQLSKTAVHALDRKRLYYILHGTADTTPTLLSEEILQETIALEIPSETLTETVVTETIIEATEPMIVVSEENTTEELEVTAPIIKETIPQHTEEEKTVSAENLETLAPEALKEVIETTEELIISEPAEISETKKEKKKKKKHKKKEKEDFDFNAQMSFNEWLKKISKIKPVQPAQTDEADELEEQLQEGQYAAALVREIKTAEATQIPETPEKWKQPVGKEDKKISVLAQKSVTQNDNTITETYAKILELQKKYPQAIAAYEKLRLKYPEKSSYFAARINDLKTK